MTRLVYILGDVHGNFSKLNDFINKKIRQHAAVRALAEDCRRNGSELAVDILQCGDFAYFWPGFDSRGIIKNQVGHVRGGRVNIFWCAGNHENHDELDLIVGKAGAASPIGVDVGVYYCPFGSTIQLAPDVTALFAGGAASTDKEWRLRKMWEGYPKIWWDQEEISDADMKRLDAVPRADWVISHTAPMDFHFYVPRKPGRDKSRMALNEVLRRYRPKRWFFGHFHEHMTGECEGTEWECLADMESGSIYYDSVKLDE